MSSITPNGSLDALGITLEDWANLTSDEQAKKIKDLIAGKSASKVEETLNGMSDDFQVEKEDIQALKKELRFHLHRSTGEKQNDIKSYISMIEEIEAELEKYKNLSVDASKNVQLHNIDKTDGGSIQVSAATLKLDGETYTYTLGSSANPFGDEEGDPRLDGVTSDGTENGTVLKDMDGDLKKNKDDIAWALSSGPDTRTDRQTIAINPPPGQHWTLASADTVTGTYTFKVVNDEGDFSYVKFENAARAVFNFTDGINPSEIDQIKDTWPPELLKNTYWGDEQKSFFEQSNLTDPASANNLSVIPGYQKAKTKMNEVDAYTDGALSDDLKQKANEALDTLYAFYNDEGDKTLQEVWNGIFASWAGISEADQAKMIQHLATAIGFSDKDDLNILFTPALGLIEDKLSVSGEPTAASKAIIVALALLKDPMGKFTDGYFAQMNPKVDEDAEYISGTWTNHADNLKALDLLDQMAAQTGVDTFIIGKYRPGEESFSPGGESSSGSSDNLISSQQFYEDNDDALFRYPHWLKDAKFDAWLASAKDIKSKIFDENGNLVRDPIKAITGHTGQELYNMLLNPSSTYELWRREGKVPFNSMWSSGQIDEREFFKKFAEIYHLDDLDLFIAAVDSSMPQTFKERFFGKLSYLEAIFKKSGAGIYSYSILKDFNKVKREKQDEINREAAIRAASSENGGEGEVAIQVAGGYTLAEDAEE